MFTAFLTFIKSKLLSLPVIFIGCLVAIISIFLIYNSDTILERFGFETERSLKAQVEVLKKDLETVKTINKNLIDAIEFEKNQGKAREKELVSYYENLYKDCIFINKSGKKKEEKISKIKQKIEEKERVIKDNNTIVLPIDEVNQHSSANIEQLNEVYDEFFKNA